MDIIQPRVSIIMPVFNNAAYLVAAIQSVQAQTMPNWELIVVDDASTDQSLCIAQAFAAADKRIRTITQPVNSGGAARPRNAALKQAQADMIAFLDSDDMWTPDKLEAQVSFMQEHDAAISHTAYRCISADGKTLGRLYHPAPLTSQSAHLQRRNIGMAAMIDRSKTGDFRFNEKAPVEDFDLFVRLLKHHDAHGLDKELYLYRRGHPSLSHGRARMIFNVLRSAAYTRHELGTARAISVFAQYSTGVVRRKFTRQMP